VSSTHSQGVGCGSDHRLARGASLVSLADEDEAFALGIWELGQTVDLGRIVMMVKRVLQGEPRQRTVCEWWKQRSHRERA